MKMSLRPNKMSTHILKILAICTALLLASYTTSQAIGKKPFPESVDGHTIIKGLIGVINKDDFYLILSSGNKYINFCESKVTKEAFKKYFNQLKEKPTSTLVGGIVEVTLHHNHSYDPTNCKLLKRRDDGTLIVKNAYSYSYIIIHNIGDSVQYKK